MGLFLQGLNRGFCASMLDSLSMWSNPFVFNPFGVCVFNCYGMGLSPLGYNPLDCRFVGNLSDMQMPSFTFQNPTYANNFSPSLFSIPDFSSSWMFAPASLYQTSFQLTIPGSSTTSETSEESQRSYNYSDEARFDKMLDFVLKWEGGLSDNKNDKGGRTYKGVTQKTYDSYRKSKKLPKQDVAKMTDSEMKDIYYERFYKASGADKISNPRLALYVFDTAVNMGPGRAKEFLEQSGKNLKKFEQLRRARYRAIAENNPSQRGFLEGWLNRMDDLVSYAKENLPEHSDIIA